MLKNVKQNSELNSVQRIITFEQPLSVSAESYRRIKLSLEFLADGKQLKVIQACSAVVDEGKISVLLNLAATYVEDGKKAIIIDLDLRTPELHKAFGVENDKGLIEYLAGTATIDEVIKSSDNGIDFITRGASFSAPIAILGSPKLNEFIELLKEKYDIILIDCPPVITAGDCCVSARVCDGTLFVVSRKSTDKKLAKNAVLVLKRSGLKLIGCVFVDVGKRGGGFLPPPRYN